MDLGWNTCPALPTEQKGFFGFHPNTYQLIEAAKLNWICLIPLFLLPHNSDGRALEMNGQLLPTPFSKDYVGEAAQVQNSSPWSKVFQAWMLHKQHHSWCEFFVVVSLFGFLFWFSLFVFFEEKGLKEDITMEIKAIQRGFSQLLLRNTSDMFLIAVWSRLRFLHFF